LAALFASSLSQAAVIGIDNRDGGDLLNGLSSFLGSSRYSTFRSIITSGGNTIVLLTKFDSAHLAGLDAVILKQPDSITHQFSTTEISSLHSFVSAGHGLLVQGEGGFNTDDTTPNLNLLVAPYGVSYASAASQANGYAIGGILPSPLTVGVSSIGVDFERTFSSVSSPAVDLTIASGSDDGLAYLPGGRVAFLSDASLWADPSTGSDRDITFGSNRQLLSNAITYISVPEPTLILPAALLLFVFSRRLSTVN
jgi:hypothetical protein